MRRAGRKLLGILLAASIVAATVFPARGMAAEEMDRGVKSEAQKEENAARGETAETKGGAGKPIATVSANVLPEMEMDEGLIMPMSYDINQPVIESFELEENGKTLGKEDTLHFKLSAYDADGYINSVVVQISQKSGGYAWNVAFQKGDGNLYTGTFPCSELIGYEGDYCVSQIRLVDIRDNYVELDTVANGQYLYTFSFQNSRTVSVSDFQIQKNASGADGNLRVGDTVTYTAHVECEGVDLESAYVIGMCLKAKKNDSSCSHDIAMNYQAQTQTLMGTYTVKEDTYPAEWRLDYIYIYMRNAYLYFYPSLIEPDEDLSFTVVNDDYDAEKPIIESITIDKNGEMVKAGETVTVKVKVDEKNPSSSMYVWFTPDVSGVSAIYAYLRLNQETMEYTGTININQDSYPAKWELTYLELSDKNGNRTYLSDFREDWNTARPWYYIVDPEGYQGDREAPVIESITIDKNGQWVYPGDTVTITVKVNEKNPSDWAYAYFYPQVSNVSSSSTITMYYNADTSGYIGEIYISESTYPCEWILTELSVSDKKGHYTYLNSFKPDWRDSCPWYYRVENDNTYREDVEDVTFSFYGLVRQEYGSYEYGYLMQNETVKNVGRRSTLKGLGILPTLPEGVNVKWRQGWSWQEVDEDTELFFRNSSVSSYDFYATYDKSCVNVFLTYLSKDEGIKMAVIPQFVDKGTTYGEVLDSLALPEDASEECFSGYELADYHNAEEQVAELDYLSVEAKYDGCLVIWNAKYIDENGNGVSKAISKSYEKGTAIGNALAALAGPDGPDGLEFEKWNLQGMDGKETLKHPMISLDVTALYKGKTTADVVYTYRGEDGKLVSSSKLMALDGENLSYAAASEEAIQALHEVSHLDGLVLSEWKNSVGTNSARYKKINLRAQYANCVVILKYPNDVYEYAVVEKGASFTLPVENEKYMDILWEGCGMGETVTITADREFLMADAKPKGSTGEGPSGEKLSEEEIDKIIADIEESGSGETILVDMKKATVVPKEVLEAIQGKEISIVLNMGAYSWTIGGNDVAATNLKDIDLEVIVDTDVIPPSIVDSLAEGKPATQISLIHDGEFGFRADLTVNLGSQHGGSVGNLYYYDSAGKLIFRDAGEIGADGNISLSFSHASDYVVIIERASSETGNENDSGQDSSGQEIVSMAKMETAALGIDGNEDKESGVPKSPKTGE